MCIHPHCSYHSSASLCGEPLHINECTWLCRDHFNTCTHTLSLSLCCYRMDFLKAKHSSAHCVISPHFRSGMCAPVALRLTSWETQYHPTDPWDALFFTHIFRYPMRLCTLLWDGPPAAHIHQTQYRVITQEWINMNKIGASGPPELSKKHFSVHLEPPQRGPYVTF